MKIDEDRPLEAAGADEYGFAPIAEKLAGSIAALADSDGVVFGIEGPWGSGKTSFLNLLHKTLGSEKGVHVLKISPWLIGDGRSLVAALGEAISPVLEAAEKTSGKHGWQLGKKKVAKTADLVRAYAARTGRGIAPLAKMAGLFVPGASAIGEALDQGANALEGFVGKPSDEALKAEIAKRIVASGIRFVVLVDDLDRLEPSQAVEVMRLIRSVADFPRFAYVLCYDREVLAQALETGLSLKNGDLYMQKIVQLTFSLPQPEPFDLRISLRRKCMDLFVTVRGREPSDEEREDIAHAIDREGSGLRTPRDVKLVLNGLKFIYPTVADEVYFPDLCRVHLLKALHPKLYAWVENYLSVRSTLVSGDASLSKPERVRIGNQLLELLPDEDGSSTQSIWSLRRFVPGVKTGAKAETRVFQAATDREVADQINDKRVGSPYHHRYYFALSAPKGMIPPARMQEIRRTAGTSVEGLQAILLKYVDEDRSLSRSWYEHFIGRLDETQLATYSFDELTGLALGFATTHEAAQRKLERRQALTTTLTDRVEGLVDTIIRRMRALDAGKVPAMLNQLYAEGSLSWLVGHFHRRQLHNHGVAGERPKPEDQWTLTREEVDAGGAILRERLSERLPKLLTLPDFGSLIWGWRDLDGVEAIKRWIATHAHDDQSFLTLLSELRGWAMSDHVYYPLRRSAVEAFFDYDQAIDRLSRLHAGDNKEVVAKVEQLRVSLAEGADRE